MSALVGGAPWTEPGVPYHGHRTQRLQTAHVWLDVLVDAGPRMVRLGTAGSGDNLLAETPDAGWDTPHGRYELFGGHRLWFAPEDPERVAIPDPGSLVIEPLTDGVRLVGRRESPTGLVRVIAIRLDATTPTFEVRHELQYEGDGPIELAPWSITQLPLGGRVVIPQALATSGHGVHPNRNVVLWPYASWTDSRLSVRDGVILVAATSGDDLKLGCLDDRGWVAYVRNGTAIVRRFVHGAGRRHPDLECNVEAYCGRTYLELEILGPLRVLADGETDVLVEQWEVRSDVADVSDPLELCALLSRPLAA